MMTRARHWKAILILFGLLFLIGSTQGIARSDEQPDQDNDPGLKEGLDYPVPVRGTGQFLALGRIDSVDMETGAIAIDDANYLLLPSTEYYTSVLGAGSIHLFREGLAAGFIANRKGEILSIWLLE